MRGTRKVLSRTQFVQISENTTLGDTGKNVGRVGVRELRLVYNEHERETNRTVNSE